MDKLLALRMADGEKITTGRVRFFDGRGDLPMMDIETPWSRASIYTHGAQVTHFQKPEDEPLLFLSQCSRFSSKEPIRGGIPIVYPWFGPKAGQAQHGFARTQRWELKEFAPARDGSVGVRFQLPPSPEAAAFPRCRVEYIVTVSAELKLELVVTNQSQDVFAFEDCLHTYFVVGDVSNISIRGLKGVEYLDKLKDYARAKETEELLRLNGEIDRTYVNTPGPVEIFDGELWRKIRIEKTSSASTVVWNPWAARAQQLADLGNEEYRHMVCVESGNIGENKIKLPPGGEHRLAVTLATERV